MSSVAEILAADVMRYVATVGVIQGLESRRAPLDINAPIASVSDLRYLRDYSEPVVEVTVTNEKGEKCLKRVRGSFEEILAHVLAQSVEDEEIPYLP